jgi:hypothetical protein
MYQYQPAGRAAGVLCTSVGAKRQIRHPPSSLRAEGGGGCAGEPHVRRRHPCGGREAWVRSSLLMMGV